MAGQQLMKYFVLSEMLNEYLRLRLFRGALREMFTIGKDGAGI